jgi:uncharacterized membrane protein
MTSAAWLLPSPLVGTSVPTKWKPVVRRSLFGDVALVIFLLAQCFDGVFTYIGVATFGIHIEANPVIASLMGYLGHGPALASAKILAGFLGICLHLNEIHGAVALLTGFYLAAAIVPWTAILFF